MKDLFQKELILINLINQMNQKNAWFVIIGILKVLVMNLNHMYVIHVMISMMAYELKSVDYRCVLWNMTGNGAINRLHNSELDDKGTLWK